MRAVFRASMRFSSAVMPPGGGACDPREGKSEGLEFAVWRVLVRSPRIPFFLCVRGRRVPVFPGSMLPPTRIWVPPLTRHPTKTVRFPKHTPQSKILMSSLPAPRQHHNRCLLSVVNTALKEHHSATVSHGRTLHLLLWHVQTAMRFTCILRLTSNVR